MASASLLLPPLIVPTSSSSSLFSRAAFPNPTSAAARFSAPNAVRCVMNRDACVPVLKDQMQSKYLQWRRSENAVNKNIKIFSGSADYALSQEIALSMGLNLENILINWWSDDGESSAELKESVRGCDVYLVQSTCQANNLRELVFMIKACKKASAKNVTAVIPNFGNSKIDGKIRRCCGSRVENFVDAILIGAGVDRVVACDIISWPRNFAIPVDCQHAILDYLANKKICPRDLVVVSPNVGRNALARAREFAARLSEAPLAFLLKDELKNLVGDVKGKAVVLVDNDMIDPDGSMVKSAECLHELGVREVYACGTKAVFSPPVTERLSNGLFQEVIVTNTVPVTEKDYFPQLTVVSVGDLVAETIWQVHDRLFGH